MGGKLPLVGIVGFGVFAAVCAAVLMAVVRIGPATASANAVTPRTVSIIVAARDIPALTRIAESDLEARDVPVDECPSDIFTDSAPLIGRVLSTPLLKGQPAAPVALLGEEGGAQLALSLPPGLRAVSIELSSTSALQGLLYPGCTVDVIGVARNSAESSRTLIQNVRVLAVGDKTLYSQEPGEHDEAETIKRPSSSDRRMMVTLMVDPVQARTLQAARERGALSLSLRNPLDDVTEVEVLPSSEAATDPTVEIDRPEPSVWHVRVVRSGDATIRTFGGPGAMRRSDDPQSSTTGDDEQPADPPSGDDS